MSATETPAGGPPPGFAAEKTDLTDIREKGLPVRGEPQFLDRRMFLQLHVFTDVAEVEPLAEALRRSGLEAVLYLNVNDPRGVGVLFMSEDPSLFVGPVRRLLTSPPFAELTPRPEFTMIGRTYSTGREADLDHFLLQKPRKNSRNPEWPWAVWYPLRRKGEFNLAPAEEQRAMMKEHAMIGYQYGEAELAHDIRLACHGLDVSDNDFVIGLIGKELYPLSRCVQEMRRTRQTGAFMEQMGPFFVGKAYWQAPLQAG
jgi:chlorite dismutase